MRLQRLFVCALSVALFTGARTVRAWNNVGHEIIATIAWQNLSLAAREKISTLLRAHPDFADYLARPADPDADLRAFQLAATWPDWVRTPGRPQYRYNHPEWHFVDFPYVLAGVPDQPQPSGDWKPGDNPANALQAHQKVLADLKDRSLSDADRAIALAWVIHLDGDIHQPLHATSLFSPQFPSGDHGGNSIRLTLTDPATGSQQITNLHALWDDMFGTDQNDVILRAEALRLMKEHPAGDMKDQIAQMDFTAWAKESFALAKTHAYLNNAAPQLTSPQPHSLPPGYMAQAMPIADRQSALAAYRLAAELDAVFAK